MQATGFLNCSIGESEPARADVPLGASRCTPGTGCGRGRRNRPRGAGGRGHSDGARRRGMPLPIA